MMKATTSLTTTKRFIYRFFIQPKNCFNLLLKNSLEYKKYQVNALLFLALLIFSLSVNSQTEVTVSKSGNFVNIPDNNAVGGTGTVYFNNIPSNAVLTNVTVSLAINHGNVGDLKMKLIAPTGDEIILVDRPERNNFGDFENADLISSHPITFSDAFSSNPELMGTIPAVGSTGYICKDDNNCEFLPNDDTANRKTFFFLFLQKKQKIEKEQKNA